VKLAFLHLIILLQHNEFEGVDEDFQINNVKLKAKNKKIDSEMQYMNRVTI